jgi:hypothetical protein
MGIGHDVQLKILQALPSLLHNYSTEIRGDLLSTILQICSGLHNAKNPAVSNTAAATLQQLVCVWACLQRCGLIIYRTSTGNSDRDRSQGRRWNGSSQTSGK